MALPGIAFRVETPAQVTLPRMDVAAFAGFAGRGPLHTPVPVEDLVQFRDLFGDPPQLAWDAETGDWQTACLGAAVADFFAQGGRRCWVVRVAGDAVTNRYPVAGLLRATPGGYTPVTARARSAGSWSDGLLVGASLMMQTLACAPLSAVPGDRLAGDFSAGRGAHLQPGDTLQLNFQGDLIAYLRVATVATAGDLQHVEGAARWFRPVRAGAPVTGALTLQGGVPAPGVTLGAPASGGPLNLTPAALQPEPGDWLTLDTVTGRIWLIAEQALDAQIQVRAAWQEVSSGNMVVLSRAARVTMALEAREDQQSRGLLRDLAFSAPHPRFWSDLPDDEAFYQLPAGQPQTAEGHPAKALRAEATGMPRYPLAGESDPAGFFIPLGLEITPIAWRGRLPEGGAALERDGLVPPEGVAWAEFIQQITLDPALRWVGEAGLVAAAFDLRYLREVRLRGLHSLTSLDEVSMLALPDAAQRGWEKEAYARIPPVPEPEREPPAACPGHALFTPKPGAEVEDPTAEEVAGLIEETEPGTRWRLRSAAQYMEDGANGLLEVHCKAAEFAAARADCVAVLGLPAHYRTRAALDHRRELGRRLVGRATASYTALAHPWLIERAATGMLWRCGPEGVLCGMMAHRSRTRGAWVAPANQVARSAVALTPEFDYADYADLYQAGFNIFRPDARGFVLWASSTLSEDADTRALNVRRLLILLRRVALRDAQDYMFQPHSPAFQRQVAAQMERLLSGLFARGAFAGNNPGEAYQVVTDHTANTPASIEQGRFIVELRVAPSLPLAFIIVRLIETGAGAFILQEG